MVWAACEFRSQLFGGCVQLTHSPQNVAGFVMQSGPPVFLCGRSAVLPQGFGKVSLLLEVACRQLAYRRGIPRQAVQIGQPFLSQSADDADGLNLYLRILAP